jgi:hypothetical protein
MNKRLTVFFRKLPGVCDSILQTVKETVHCIRIALELIRLLWWGAYDLL